MKKHILIFACSLLIGSSCQSSNSSTNNENKQDSVVAETVQTETKEAEEVPQDSNQEVYVAVYRSDGFRPNMASEWVQVSTTSETNKITEILYWNVQNEEKMNLEIVSQEYASGEISGYTGSVRFPNAAETVGFGIIEDRFNLTPEGEKMQEFFYEQK